MQGGHSVKHRDIPASAGASSKASVALAAAATAAIDARPMLAAKLQCPVGSMNTTPPPPAPLLLLPKVPACLRNAAKGGAEGGRPSQAAWASFCAAAAEPVYVCVCGACVCEHALSSPSEAILMSAQEATRSKTDNNSTHALRLTSEHHLCQSTQHTETRDTHEKHTHRLRTLMERRGQGSSSRGEEGWGGSACHSSKLL